MVVLHIISGGEVGGSKNHLLSIVKNMDESKIKNIVICFIKGSLYEEAVKIGIDIRLIEQNKRFDLSILKDIQKICIREKVDIINCHGGRANFIGYFLMKKYAAKYVTTIHSDYKDDYRGNFYKTLIYSNINRFVLRSFNYYITVSEDFKGMLIKRGFNKEKIFVVYNGIDFNKPIPELNRDDIIRKYNIPFSSHYVTMVARLHPVKGHKVFLKACSLVLKSFKDVVFILVGDGNIKEELIQYAKELGIFDKIIFAGFQKPDEFIYISDFTVLASYSESFPLSILESALYKKTVISTDVGGISKLIEDRVNGYLIKIGDYETLSMKILSLLNDKEESQNYGNKLYYKASQNFSIEKLCNKYEEIYLSMINGGL
ncbi:Glycosyltransferase involved in cell wall bisynthesis [Caloramator quimbayensis]|uniref:Glycosyltransferase involved in cell wall bisynthesis n=1 Tax=Caloramator quimbayensis TaxID=1147123 RepID=A0A1T4WSU3_9CLOT|nr:glycosyltransferase family 4 protein [Caloramator quimbayensis]SKA79908.1 Glycosyltransferase involved in cell wall bisynthesis [Caloramator quimbayensis]